MELTVAQKAVLDLVSHLDDGAKTRILRAILDATSQAMQAPVYSLLLTGIKPNTELASYVISVIKALRTISEMPLKEAKDMVDGVRAGRAALVIQSQELSVINNAKRLIAEAGGFVAVEKN